MRTKRASQHVQLASSSTVQVRVERRRSHGRRKHHCESISCASFKIWLSCLERSKAHQKTNDKNHPLTGIPVYFVHPCATSEALKSVAGDKEQTTETYLLLWIGLVGNCVGLNVPLELVAQAGNL